MSIYQKMRPTWQQTMLRIRNPKKSTEFYKQHFGFTLLDVIHFPAMKFSLYFMATLREGEKFDLTPGSDEAHQFLWKFDGVTIELTYNHGCDDFVANNGNVEPNRGFGHIAVLCDDVYASCEKLEKNGVQFQKRPDEGRMKGLAFALDADGYWIEIVKRTEGSGIKQEFNYAQTMMRVKDATKSVSFYEKYFNMTLVRGTHYPDAKFSNFFLASLTDEQKSSAPDNSSPEAKSFVNSLFHPVLELTHNHGTESDDSFSYHNGNTDPKGFGHIGFLVDDLCFLRGSRI